VATTFYFPETLAAPVTPPAAAAAWEHINTVTRSLLTTPDGSTLTTTAYTPDAADDLVSGDALHRQYVSGPLIAQTLGGNVTAQFQMTEVNTGCNQFLTLKLLVCSNDGTTVRATLLDVTRDTTNEVATSLTNRNFPSTALAGYTCIKGDRLVIEVGCGGTPTAASGVNGHNCSIRFGCSASSGDLPADDSTTGTTYRPWVAISTSVMFDDTPGKVSVIGQAIHRAASY